MTTHPCVAARVAAVTTFTDYIFVILIILR